MKNWVVTQEDKVYCGYTRGSLRGSLAGSGARTSFLTWFFAPSVVQVPSSALHHATKKANKLEKTVYSLFFILFAFYVPQLSVAQW